MKGPRLPLPSCWASGRDPERHAAESQGRRHVSIRHSGLNACLPFGFHNVYETNFGLTHAPDRNKANMRAYMWFQMKDRLLTGANRGR
jgi:hypothetical protein